MTTSYAYSTSYTGAAYSTAYTDYVQPATAATAVATVSSDACK